MLLQSMVKNRIIAFTTSKNVNYIGINRIRINKNVSYTFIKNSVQFRQI